MFQLAAGYNNFNRFSVYIENLNTYRVKRKPILGYLVPDMRIYRGSKLFKLLVKSKITYKVSFPLIIGEKNYLCSETFMTGYFQDYPRNLKGIHTVREIVKVHTKSQQELLCKEFVIDQNKSLAIHIRLGDYLNETKFWIINEQYLENSIQNFDNIDQFYIFCQEELPTTLLKSLKKFNKKLVFIRNINFTDYQEFILLSSFKNLIISNSTFSFWAGIIDYNGIRKKVLAPEMYYKKPILNSKWIENCKMANFQLL